MGQGDEINAVIGGIIGHLLSDLDKGNAGGSIILRRLGKNQRRDATLKGDGYLIRRPLIERERPQKGGGRVVRTGE
jgi:hypothetical protein